ncbi:MAG: hypothetical protein WCK89_12675, partial [bacterium]
CKNITDLLPLGRLCALETLDLSFCPLVAHYDRNQAYRVLTAFTALRDLKLDRECEVLRILAVCAASRGDGEYLAVKTPEWLRTLRAAADRAEALEEVAKAAGQFADEAWAEESLRGVLEILATMELTEASLLAALRGLARRGWSDATREAAGRCLPGNLAPGRALSDAERTAQARGYLTALPEFAPDARPAGPARDWVVETGRALLTPMEGDAALLEACATPVARFCARMGLTDDLRRWLELAAGGRAEMAASDRMLEALAGLDIAAGRTRDALEKAARVGDPALRDGLSAALARRFALDGEPEFAAAQALAVADAAARAKVARELAADAANLRPARAVCLLAMALQAAGGEGLGRLLADAAPLHPELATALAPTAGGANGAPEGGVPVTLDDLLDELVEREIWNDKKRQRALERLGNEGRSRIEAAVAAAPRRALAEALKECGALTEDDAEEWLGKEAR